MKQKFFTIGFRTCLVLTFENRCVCGLDIHFRESDEDIPRRRGSGGEKDARPPHPVSPASSSLNTMRENVCFLLTDKKIFALSKPP